ncbi:MAG: glucosamine-6-phosphate deaminase [Candidatus Pacearchaeota archaeon]
MRIIKTKNYKELSKKATEILAEEIKNKPDTTLLLPTGKTPLGLYKNLVKKYNKKRIDFSKIKIFNLDEYYLIDKDDKRSFNYYLRKNLLDKINAKKENVLLINGKSKDSKKECENYENKIRKNPVDIAILGVGKNGHIAFNEPSSKFNSKTRLVKLTNETIKRNSSFFKKAPNKAITLGIKTILSSKKIVLLASGKEKAKAIKELVSKRISEEYPVSFLKKHKNLLVIIDKEAGKYIK